MKSSLVACKMSGTAWHHEHSQWPSQL